MNFSEKYFKFLFQNQGELSKESFLARIQVLVSLFQRTH